MVKQKLTLSIDKKIITQAKMQNINLSSFLEIRLIDYLSDKEKMQGTRFEHLFTGKKYSFLMLSECPHRDAGVV